jgi:hypothetical protein
MGRPRPRGGVLSLSFRPPGCIGMESAKERDGDDRSSRMDRTAGRSVLRESELYSLCAAVGVAHGDAEWIQRNPRNVTELGHHCCSNECTRWDAQAFREEGDEIIIPPSSASNATGAALIAARTFTGGRACRVPCWAVPTCHRQPASSTRFTVSRALSCVAPRCFKGPSLPLSSLPMRWE